VTLSRRAWLVALVAAYEVRAAHHKVCPAEGDIEPGTPPSRTYDGRKFRIYTAGSSGPPIVLLHELPGLWQCDINLAQRLADKGFKVHVPLFFGSKGESNTTKFLFRECLLPSPFFLSALLPRHTPKVRGWVSGFVRDLSAENGDKGVGVIGMCLTGGLPAALIAMPEVKAAVLSQPTNPFLFPSTLDVTPRDLKATKRRLAGEPEMRVLGLRFSKDALSHDSRFDTLGKALGDHFTTIVIDSAGATDAHSVLAGDYEGPLKISTADVFDKVVRYLNHRLNDRPEGADFPGRTPACDGSLRERCRTYPKLPEKKR
jgi:dienelactone hydrolase